MIELNVQEVFQVHSDPIPLSNPIVPEIWQQWFQAWGKALASDLPVASDYEITLRLTGDQEIQSLNAQYRQKNQPTDVLAFATLEWDFPTLTPEETNEPLYLGDIIISLETASKQAQQQGHPLKRELAWLATHGFLHLLGWDHPDQERLQAMLQQQETLLKFIGL